MTYQPSWNTAVAHVYLYREHTSLQNKSMVHSIWLVRYPHLLARIYTDLVKVLAWPNHDAVCFHILPTPRRVQA